MKLEKNEAMLLLKTLLENGQVKLPAAHAVFNYQQQLLENWVYDEKGASPNMDAFNNPFTKTEHLLKLAGKLDAFYIRSFLDGLTSDKDSEQFVFFNFIQKARELDAMLKGPSH